MILLLLMSLITGSIQQYVILDLVQVLWMEKNAANQNMIMLILLLLLVDLLVVKNFVNIITGIQILLRNVVVQIIIGMKLHKFIFQLKYVEQNHAQMADKKLLDVLYLMVIDVQMDHHKKLINVVQIIYLQLLLLLLNHLFIIDNVLVLLIILQNHIVLIMI